MLIALISSSLFAWILTLVPGLSGVDGYFHIRYSKMIWEGGLPETFNHLVYTIYSNNYANDHMLFHIIQIPFTFGNLITGAKFYGAALATLSILLFFHILKHHKIQYAFAWTILLLVSSAPFLVRICMARAPGISLCILLLATHLVLLNKDQWLLPISFLYVWFYGGFPLVVGLAFSVFLASLLEQKERPRAIFYCGAGVILGLVLHPYFPNNVVFLFKSYTQIEFADVVSAGNEDYPYASSTVVRNALLPWAMMLITAGVYFVKHSTLSYSARILFIYSTLLLCAYMNVRRFVEYWPAFALLFSAFAINPFIVKFSEAKYWHTLVGKFAIGLTALTFTVSGYDTLNHIVDYRKSDKRPEAYQGAAEYIQANSHEGDIVFTGDWDDFPMLFHFNTHNRYIVGLDPHYMYYFDPKLYDLWLNIIEGDEPDPVTKIQEKFKAKFVFASKSDDNFLDNLQDDKRLQEPVFENKYSVVYKLGD